MNDNILEYIDRNLNEALALADQSARAIEDGNGTAATNYINAAFALGKYFALLDVRYNCDFDTSVDVSEENRQKAESVSRVLDRLYSRL